MIPLALRSLRFRAGGFVASFLAIFLGATIVMAFTSMLDTGAGNGVDATSEETLFLMAMVVGGWGLVSVAFAVASTLGLSVRQRGAEVALLRSVGATPSQIRWMVLAEAGALAIVAGVAAIPVAMLAGRGLLELLQGTDQVAPAVAYRFGPIGLGAGLAITFAAATAAALVVARRATRGGAADSARVASVDDGRIGKKRVVWAIVCLAIGLDLAVVTGTVMSGEGIEAMSTAGQASIFVAIGLALLAPVLVRRFSGRLAGSIEGRAGAEGYLAALNVRQRTNQMASALMPIILFTGIATGTLYMQSIENSVSFVAGSGVTAAESRSIETLNFVVVGMIAVFAAIMLVNTLVAATASRRQEFGQLRLAGSAPRQVLRMVRLEGLVLLLTGIVFGTVASIFTILPYSIARTDSILPDASFVSYLEIIGAATLLTLGASVGAARRALRAPAIEAVTPREL